MPRLWTPPERKLWAGGPLPDLGVYATDTWNPSATITAPGTGGAYSTYTQLIATTSWDALLVSWRTFWGGSSADTSTYLQFGLAAGASGAEVDFLVGGSGAYSTSGTVASQGSPQVNRLAAPIFIPAGTRLAFHTTVSAGGADCTLFLDLLPFAVTTQEMFPFLSRIGRGLAADVAPRLGTVGLTPAATPWSAWVEMSAGLAVDAVPYSLCFGYGRSNTMYGIVAELGVGASGSEKAVTWGLGQSIATPSTNSGNSATVSPFLPVVIPAGAHIPMRAYANSITGALTTNLNYQPAAAIVPYASL